MRDPILALDVDLTVALRGRAALREQIDELPDGDPLAVALGTLTLMLGDR